jgi:hypothetical protein
MFRNLFRRSSRPAKPARRSFRPTIEALEHRCVPTTTTQLGGYTLWVTGDSGDQNITLTQLRGDTYMVSAPDLSGGLQTFNGIQDIAVNTGAGTDSVTLNGILHGPALPYALTVGGTGVLSVIENSLNVAGLFDVTDTTNDLNVTVNAGTALGQLTVGGGAGNDHVTLTSVAVNNQTNIIFGNGTNSLTIQQDSVLDGPLGVTASGNTTVTLTDAFIGYTREAYIGMNLAGGWEAVTLRNTLLNGNLSVAYAGLLQRFNLWQSQVHGFVYVSGGTTIRAAHVNGSTIDGYLKCAASNGVGLGLDADQINSDLTVDAGTGNCFVGLGGTTVKGETAVGGRGNGRFWAGPEASTGNPTILNGSLDVNFAGASASSSANITLSGVTVNGGLALLTGAGDDSITIEGSSIDRLGVTATIQMGGGDDTLQLLQTTFYSNGVYFDGGSGSNTLSMIDVEFPNYPPLAQPIIINFLSPQ